MTKRQEQLLKLRGKKKLMVSREPEMPVESFSPALERCEARAGKRYQQTDIGMHWRVLEELELLYISDFSSYRFSVVVYRVAVSNATLLHTYTLTPRLVARQSSDSRQTVCITPSVCIQGGFPVSG